MDVSPCDNPKAYFLSKTIKSSVRSYLNVGWFPFKQKPCKIIPKSDTVWMSKEAEMRENNCKIKFVNRYRFLQKKETFKKLSFEEQGLIYIPIILASSLHAKPDLRSLKSI